jgi:hypothetical protein
MESVDRQLVSIKAYELWESRGKPEGASEQIWLEAERLLRQGSPQSSVAERSSSQPVIPVATPAKENVESLDGKRSKSARNS